LLLKYCSLKERSIAKYTIDFIEKDYTSKHQSPGDQ